ncbi:lipopolysaccharide biosynthesis protein [Brevibacillus migulae]|uniref:lipopolysaccharide biosynthesis protein n=1 Tax=Brevibacillus migulae TaxID=1644114 RepID=UPI00106E4C94|nr:lipopolysaccharide biosynthesis protein [Brevibacillus migulae]
MKTSRLAGVIRLGQSRFVRQIMIVMTGTGLAQVITVLLAPIISRLYEPSAFGYFSLYSSIVSVLAVIASLRYEVAICLPKRDEEAGHLLVLAILTAAGISSAALLFLLFGGQKLVADYVPRHIVPWLWWIPLSLLAMGVFQSLTYWSTRKEAYVRLSAAQISRSVAVNTAQLSGGILQQGLIGLLGGQLLGQLMASGVLAYQTWKDQGSLFRQMWSWEKIKLAGHRYLCFPLYSAPQSLLNAISQNVPTFLLMNAYGSTVVGWYALAHRLLEMPLSLLGQSLTQVYYQRASAASQQKADVYGLLVKSTISLALTVLIPVLLVIMFGPELFMLALGEQWQEAGRYGQWLVIWLFIGFLGSPSFATAQVYGLQHFLLGYEIALFLSRTSILYWGVTHADARTSIAFYCVVGALFNGLLIVCVVVYGWRKLRLEEAAAKELGQREGG